MHKLPIDILESDILKLDAALLDILLSDKTTGEYIIWATDDYLDFGEEYAQNRQMLPVLITGDKSRLIQPRASKSKSSQSNRTRDKAEVFTPSWVCNEQNNLVDRAWFGRNVVFNHEFGTTWKATKWSVEFPKKLGKTWIDYVRAVRLEVCCGEAPYLVSRYDTVTGKQISLRQRIGILDRKLRVVSENTDNFDDWYYWVKEAYRSTYGYEYQGDNLLLARENLLLTFSDWVRHKAKRKPTPEELREIAEILAWNIWQMDGLKYVIPGSCHSIETDKNLFGESEIIPCQGCKRDDYRQHNGIYCTIMDWENNEQIRFADVIGGAKP